MEKRSMFIVFSDLKGFSKMNEQEFKNFYEHYLKLLVESIRSYKDKAIVWNTWGDAFIALFENGEDAVSLMLEYQNFFRKHKLSMTPRIAGHYGEVYIFEDPMLNNRKNAVGEHINRTARIEPVTFPGEIYITEDFVQAYKQFNEMEAVFFEDLGDVQLAKKFGEQHLHRLYSAKDEGWNVTNLFFKYNLKEAIPPRPQVIDVQERDVVQQVISVRDKDELLILQEKYNFDMYSGPFLLELAKVYKKFGVYDTALMYIKKVEAWSVVVNEINLYPFIEDKEVVKLKANCLTRMGNYDEAANLMHALLKENRIDSDALAMLAAQFKRRALYKEDCLLDRESINFSDLRKALDLYLEAFRVNPEDFYPAINAVYIQKILGLTDCFTFANYISDRWSEYNEESWWYYSTLAEVQLIHDRYEASERLMKRAIRLGKPNTFEKQSTLDQIKQYLFIMGLEKEGAGIVKLLRSESEKKTIVNRG
ncbi:tetratricopeptide repeat-containing protein [Bacillus cereus]|uniref:tetratricopeptide repeat-containing protein n=1 Tax=Bacillus cereus group TaxID=86661 RepID=UPI00053950DD|nr:tetratricopeptide repeat-containing protein [Bacillus cereus]HDR4562579.1 adenylate/guanylate cyclase domain-containing protein [Bacillus luti]